MKNTSIKILSLILVLTFIFSFAAPVSAYYADASKIEITLTSGNSTMSVNGEISKITKPRYLTGNVLYVPLRPVMEAFGAEVTWRSGNKVEIAFRNISAEITLKKTEYSCNQEAKELEAAPVLADGSLMVPVSFITDNFGINKEKSGNSLKLILPDDGALNDLSFLTGGIGTTYIGNSYFGWNVSIPKGSRIASMSFNSGYVLIENEQRQIGLEVYVSNADEMTLKEYYEMMSDNPGDYFDGDVLDSSLTESSSQSYAQFLYTNSYDEAALRRVYVKDNSAIAFTLTAYGEADPSKIMKNETFKSILNSFKTAYPTASRDVQDISKVKYGLAKYENYINSDSGKKYFTWEMSVLPAWNEMMDSSTQYYQEIGTSRKEYVSVEVTSPESGSGAEAYRKETRQYYESNFSRKAYTFISEASSVIGAEKAFGLNYSMKIGDMVYVYNEWFISSAGLIYDVTFKCPQDSYEERKQDFQKMFETFRVYSKDSENLLKDVEKYQFAQSKNRIGKDDSYTLYENKQFSWSAKLPGYWLKNSAEDSNVQYFYNNTAFTSIVVQAIDAAAIPKDIPEEDKYSYLSDLINQEGLTEVSRSSGQFNGMPCTHIVYRIEDEDAENYADVNVYMVKGSKYSYCVMDILPDISASDSNIQELGKILNSFTIKAETSAAAKDN